MKTCAHVFQIKTPDKSHYLVDKHKGKAKFRIEPDIVAIGHKNNNQIIFDTKWKLLNEFQEKNNYKISQSDMYQLYAYGKKYDIQNPDTIEPKLALIYPSNPNFKNPLESFIYENNLVLNVLPFDLKSCLSNADEVKELDKIMSFLNIPVF